MLYHVSATPNIKVLEPRLSTHGKAYVYAIGNLVTGLLFGAKQDDFDFHISTDEAGIPSCYECYPGALEAKYKDKSCTVYELPEEGFLRGKTDWDAELVCETKVPVQKAFLSLIYIYGYWRKKNREICVFIALKTIQSISNLFPGILWIV